MKKLFFFLLASISVLAFISCSTGSEELGDADSIGNTDNIGETDDSDDTGNSEDTGNTGKDSDIVENSENETNDDGEDYSNHACYERSGDADGDGIANEIECPDFPCLDSDGDELPDCLDADSDGDSISDSVECSAEPCEDTDSDGIPDFIDRDSDNDGLSDKKEKEIGTDFLDKDTDDDGTDDLAEIVGGTDPTDPDSKISEGLFYVVLPYGAPDRVERKLTFSTKINSVDVGILLDRSGSMTNELENLKTGIQNELIDGILSKMDAVDLAMGLISFGTWDDGPYTVEQRMTKDYDAVNSAVGNTSIQGSGAHEPHSESIYQASTGEGLYARCHITNPINPWEVYTIDPGDCTGAEGSVGGICLREMTFPIFIMLTDVAFIEYPVGSAPFGEEYWDINARGHSREEAILAMNGINAKFIGIDTGFNCSEYDASYNCIGTETPSDLVKDDFTLIAQGTASLDKNGDPFLYHTTSSDGSGLSDQIADAVVELTTYVQMDVTTATFSDDSCEGISAAEFVNESVPDTANPPDGVASSDSTTFYKVEPGTNVTFMVYFLNDFCINNTENPIVYEAMIRVLGDGAYVSSKKIQIIIPAGDQT